MDTLVSPPFSNLPSFIVDGTILAYYGTSAEVIRLLNALSHNAQRYKAKHGVLLRELVVDWRPEIWMTLEFGEKLQDDEDWDFSWPDKDELCALPYHKRMKLAHLKYSFGQYSVAGRGL